MGVVDRKVETEDRKMLDLVNKSPEDLHQREHEMVMNMLWVKLLIDYSETDGGDRGRAQG